MNDLAGLAGLDLDALTRWLDAAHPGLRQGALTASRLTGGFSNLTYRVGDGLSRWALRRPPLAHALPTAHDMAREYRVLNALHPNGFPVAQPVAFCDDTGVLGAPFYLMSFVDGVALDDPALLRRLTPSAAARSCELMVTTLAQLHELDPDAVGLADFGRPEGFLARQLRRWTTQWASNETEPRPAVHALIARLTEAVPEQSTPGVVHGDYRLTNLIYGLGTTGGADGADAPDGAAGEPDRIAAVVDWEMATIGDPLTDLGLLVVYQDLSNTGGFVMPALAPQAGFDTPEQIVERYAAASSRSLHALPWYVAFGWFKLAVIAEGIHHRFRLGKTIGAGFDQFGVWVPRLLDRGLDTIGQPGPN